MGIFNRSEVRHLDKCIFKKCRVERRSRCPSGATTQSSTTEIEMKGQNSTPQLKKQMFANTLMEKSSSMAHEE